MPDLAEERLELARQIVLESEQIEPADIPQDIVEGAKAAITKAKGRGGKP